LLRELLRRADISATAKNICTFLLIERTNAATGQCYCSNQHIADQTGSSLTAVKDARRQLRRAGVIAYTNPVGNRPGEASIYSFLRLGVGKRPNKQSDSDRGENRPVENRPRTTPEQRTVKITEGTNQWTAWRDHYQRIGDYRARRMRCVFHLRVPTEWPPNESLQ
jgi:hypothetical protein